MVMRRILYNILRSSHSLFAGVLLVGLLVPRPVAAQAAAPAGEVLPKAIPLFPLPDVMLFPDMSVPLHIYEPRYRAMLTDALKGDRVIGMATLRPGYEAEYERSPSIFPTGTAGKITEVKELPDGEFDIVVEALVKFRIDREVPGPQSYRVAEVTPLPEPVAASERAALSAARARLETLVGQSDGRLGIRAVPAGIPDRDLVNGLSQLVTLDPLDRLRLLNEDGVLARARALIGYFEAAIAAP